MLPQSQKIKIKLFKHQRLSIQDMIEREKLGYIKLDISDNSQNNRYGSHFMKQGKYKINCNISILGNDPGSGKTLTMLGLIAHDQELFQQLVPKYTYIEDSQFYYNTFKENTYSDSSITVQRKYYDKYINCNLIIVPHGGVFRQWKKTILEQTKFKSKFIETNRDLHNIISDVSSGLSSEEIIKKLSNVLDKSDTEILLISSSFYCKFADVYKLVEKYNYNGRLLQEGICWHRVIIDEADSIRCPDMRIIRYRFAWFVTATWKSLSTPRNNGFIKNIFKNYPKALIHKLAIQKNEEYYEELFSNVVRHEYIYDCLAPISYISNISNIISSNVLEMINANNLNGAIRELGGKIGSGEEISDLLTRNIKRRIQRLDYDRRYIVNNNFMSPEIKEQRLVKIDEEIVRLNSQLNSIKNRVTNADNEDCVICQCPYVEPICLDCSHIFCGKCILQWIRTKRRAPCPFCKKIINVKTMSKISNTQSFKNKVIDKKIGKNETILQIIHKFPKGKFIIFSNHYESFESFERFLKNHRNIYKRCKRLCGNPNTVSNILRNFENGSIDIILLNSQHNGAGIDLPTATHVILYHKLRDDLEKQVIGRALRIGRPKTLPLHIHKLCYPNEKN